MWIIIVLVLSVSCAVQNHELIIVDENVKMRLNLDVPNSLELGQKNVPIFIKLTNSSKADYEVSSVKHWSNISIQLKKGTELIHGIKVKPDLSKRKQYVFLGAGKSIKEEFDFHLDDIYTNLTRGLYTIEVKYNGNILDENKRLVSSPTQIATTLDFIME